MAAILHKAKRKYYILMWLYGLCWKSHLSSDMHFYLPFLSGFTPQPSHLWVERYPYDKEQKKTFALHLSREAKE